MNKIFQQASWLFFSQLLTKGISFFYTIFLARSLGVEEFGLFTVAFAYFSILSAIADFGFNRFLIREIAQDNIKTHQLLWHVVLLRISLTSLIFAIFAVFLYIFDKDSMKTSLILLSSLAILPQAIALTFDGIFVALKRLQFSALTLFISTLSTSFFGFLLVTSGYGVIGAVNALLIGQLVFALVYFLIIGITQGLAFPKIQLSIIKQAIVGSLPYGILGVLGLLYFKIDSIMLSYLRGNYETGIYGTAYRFLETIIFIPSAFAAALFPNMAILHENNLSDLKKLYFKSLKAMLFLGLLLFAVYIYFVPLIIRLFLPNYLSSIHAIQILSISIPFIFLATPGVQVLLSSNKHLKPVVILSFMTLAFNIIANLIFIPAFGFIAASWITVISDVASFIIFFLHINFYIFKVKD